MSRLQLQLGRVRRRHHRLGIDGHAIFNQGGIFHGDCLLCGTGGRCVRPSCSVPYYFTCAPPRNNAALACGFTPLLAVSRSPNVSRGGQFFTFPLSACLKLAATENSTMKAAYYETTGTPDVIRYGDLPTPTPKEGEVLVRVGAAALNPIDTYIRSGAVSMSLPKPFIPGCDLAGTVTAVGPGVKAFRIGDRVWGSNQGLLGRQGTFAEYACVLDDWLYPSPPGVADEIVAAAALVGITAHLGLFRGLHTQAGEIVFVNGGTGGVGSMVGQMAKAVGAHVITTVGSAEKADLCKWWGADLVLNYKTDDVPAGIRAF